MIWIEQNKRLEASKLLILFRLVGYLLKPVRSRETSNIRLPTIVTLQHTGRRGRPRKVANPDFLREVTAPGRHVHVTEIAQAIGMDRKTLKKRLDEEGIELGYSTLTDDELDTIVRDYRQAKPASGIRYLDGHLRTLGHKVQETRIKASVEQVDPLGPVLHSRTTIPRGEYAVPRPNALWHIDGHHKLIRYGIVIHGIVDGYCRTVCIDSNNSHFD